MFTLLLLACEAETFISRVWICEMNSCIARWLGNIPRSYNTVPLVLTRISEPCYIIVVQYLVHQN